MDFCSSNLPDMLNGEKKFKFGDAIRELDNEHQTQLTGATIYFAKSSLQLT
jgi:hypothetical protein